MAIPWLFNPVPGITILPVNGPWPTPNYQFKVVSTFAQHVASGRGPGIDIANGRAGDPIYAMVDGKVTARFTDTSGALVLRYLHAASGMEFGIAHMSAYAAGTGVGSLLRVGQRIATLDTTGRASGPHLHGGCKAVNLSGDPEQDWWPYLFQNRTAYFKQAGINIRSNQGVVGGTSPGPLFATTHVDGHIRRVSDNKDLGLWGTKRAIRQPVVGAKWTLPSGATGTWWLRIWLDGAWRFVAYPLATIA